MGAGRWDNARVNAIKSGLSMSFHSVFTWSEYLSNVLYFRTEGVQAVRLHGLKK